jgi:hypothetical protein
VWVLLAILAVGLVALIVVLARPGGSSSVLPEARQRQLDGAEGSWAAQGWAIQSQTAESAVLVRAGESMLVSVDSHGHVTARPLSSG